MISTVRPMQRTVAEAGHPHIGALPEKAIAQGLRRAFDPVGSLTRSCVIPPSGTGLPPVLTTSWPIRGQASVRRLAHDEGVAVLAYLSGSRPAPGSHWAR